jgi:hypothetical protein
MMTCACSENSGSWADEQGYEIPRADVQLARLLDGPRENK